MTLRVVVVDDERLARRYLIDALAAHPDVVVVAECATVAEAAESLSAQAVDGVFLDIQLRGESGFDLLAHLDGPQVVFVTAHDAYAIRAFEVNALDYLLKPVEPERLARTLARLRGGAAQPGRPAETTGRPLTMEDRLFLQIGARAQFVAVRDILALVAADDYTTLVLRDGRRPLVATTMATWEARLPAQEFVRIHRSAMVQFAAVTALEPWSHGTWRVRVAGIMEPLPMSRRVASALRQRLG